MRSSGLSVFAIGIVWTMLAVLAQGATFTVTTNTDVVGVGSLRDAINSANAAPGSDTINFSVGTLPPNNPITISPTGALPAITDQVIIDGWSQTGSNCPPGVEIEGSGIPGSTADGLQILAPNCHIRGLVINRFPAHGIYINYFAGGNQVYGCYVGTDRSGSSALANGLNGIIIVNSPNNWIGNTPLTDCAYRNIISGNSNNGIRVVGIASTGNRIQNNYIGTDVSGFAPIPNRWNGVQLDTSANQNYVGITSSVRPVNIISANQTNGVYVLGTASQNYIYGNTIGSDRSGNALLGNGEDGVLVNDSGANQIGSSGGEGGNLISANGDDGVEIRGTNSIGNIVLDNLVGLNSLGTVALGNGSDGVVLYDRPTQNQIGSAIFPNTISGNRKCGVAILQQAFGNFVWGNYIGLDQAGMYAVTNEEHGVLISDRSIGNSIGKNAGGSGDGNYISGNGKNDTFNGIMISDGSDGNQVGANRIGLNVANAAVGNSGDGIQIRSSVSNNIGIGAADTGNLISGNGGDGIQLGTNASLTVVTMNRIGTDTNGLSARPNGGEGIYIFRSATNFIGTPAANFISGNQGSGIKVGDDPSAHHNVIVNNRIGLDGTGNAKLGNSDHGVWILNAQSNFIGTSAVANVISGNDAHGVILEGDECKGNLVQNNIIGLNVAGLIPRGNGQCGVMLYVGPTHNLIGGNPGLGNIIGGNESHGIALFWETTRNNLIQGNSIGINAAGNRAGNWIHGVYCLGDASDNQIGNADTNLGNRIAHNLDTGVRVLAGSNNLIRGNSIYSNTQLGVDIGPAGVTPNDEYDPDTGANQQQNYPVIFSVTTNGTSMMISYTLNSVTGQAYDLEFFLNDEADASGYGEGQHFVYHTNLFTASGNYTWYNKTLSIPVHAGQYVTVLMTDPYGNSSEFSAAAEIVPRLLYDADGDGMPSSWETNNGLNELSAVGPDGAIGDPDTDSVRNFDEYIADTDPWDATNYLRFTSIAQTNGTLVVYTSTNTRYYVVDYTTNLVETNTAWTGLYTPSVQGENGTSWTNDLSGSTNRFYRVKVELRR